MIEIADPHITGIRLAALPSYLHAVPGGFNADCFVGRGKVHKIINAGSDWKGANEFVSQLQGEYKLNKQYLGDYVLPTQIELQSSAEYGRFKELWVAELTQDFVQGTPLRQALDMGNPLVRDFFEKILLMNEETAIIPDVLPDISPDIPLINPPRHSNTLLVDGYPTLVDSVSNRIFRSRFGSRVVRNLAVERIKSLLNRG